LLAFCDASDVLVVLRIGYFPQAFHTPPNRSPGPKRAARGFPVRRRCSDKPAN